MITRRGVGIIVVAIAVFFLASSTRVGWVHLADAVLWGVILLSLAIPWISMPGLRLERTVDRSDRRGEPGPVEGDDLPVTLKLANRWWLPRFLVSVTYPVTVSGSSKDRRSVFFWNWPRRTAESKSPVKIRRRGQHVFGEATLEITGPFGMFRRRRRVAISHGVLAYPAWRPMTRLGLLEALSGEHEGRRKSRTGVDASGTRAYVAGDSYRSIHWRNSARSGRLAVREFDTWNDRAVVFAIDTFNVTGKAPESSLDYAARIAASCAKVIEREGGTVSISTASGESPDFMAWSDVMEHLARLEPELPAEGSLSQRIANLESGRRVIALLSETSTTETAAIIDAARRGVACAAVVFETGKKTEVGTSSLIPILQQAGVAVVSCARGGLEQTLSEIETGVARVGRNAGKVETWPGEEQEVAA